MMFGSSPLVRGQPFDGLGAGGGLRIIPARAGPTHGRWKAPSATTDHPRSCGANREGVYDGFSVGGSSPLVRGQHTELTTGDIDRRIIPARAGPTTLSMPGCRSNQDHPRSCGANEDEHGLLITAKGSSPLVRGQQPRTSALGRKRRIIPARAGPTIGCSKTRLS